MQAVEQPGVPDRRADAEQPATESLDGLGQRTVRKAAMRLILVISICYFVAYLDRRNNEVGAFEMNKDLGMTASMFGFGAGVFFLMYFTMEVPSDHVMRLEQDR